MLFHCFLLHCFARATCLRLLGRLCDGDGVCARVLCVCLCCLVRIFFHLSLAVFRQFSCTRLNVPCSPCLSSFLRVCLSLCFEWLGVGMSSPHRTWVEIAAVLCLSVGLVPVCQVGGALLET